VSFRFSFFFLSSKEILICKCWQENDHLKMIISKIEALRPNVLLVEKSVASCAQEYLLAKEISLVLNVKRPLLERIARCTGALVTPSVDCLSKARLGHCELFRLDRMMEDHETTHQLNKKPTKTLMFFEGCPRRLGCTVFLFLFIFFHVFLHVSFCVRYGYGCAMVSVSDFDSHYRSC